MQTYFYIRVSSKDQNTIRQEVMAREHKIPTGNVFIEKVSGKNVTDRPVLQNLMSILKPEDKVVVDSISRFARNTKDLIDLVEQLNDRCIIFVSLKENIDTTTPTGMFMVSILGAVAQLERDHIRQRQAEGIAIAVEQGKFKGSKPNEVPPQWNKYYKMVQDKSMTNIEAMRAMGLKKTTFYKILKEYKADDEN